MNNTTITDPDLVPRSEQYQTALDKVRSAIEADEQRESAKRRREADELRAFYRQHSEDVARHLAASKAMEARIRSTLGNRNRDEVICDLLDTVGILTKRIEALEAER